MRRSFPSWPFLSFFSPVGPLGYLSLLGPAWFPRSSRAPRTEGCTGRCDCEGPGLQVCVGEAKSGEKHGCSGPGGGNGDQLQSRKKVKVEVKEKGLEMRSSVSEESQEKACPSVSSGRAWASGNESSGAPGEFPAFPFPACPPLPTTTLSLASCPLLSTLKTTELCPLPNAQGYSSGIESCSSLGLASVGDLGFNLSDPQGLLEALF